MLYRPNEFRLSFGNVRLHITSPGIVVGMALLMISLVMMILLPERVVQDVLFRSFVFIIGSTGLALLLISIYYWILYDIRRLRRRGGDRLIGLGSPSSEAAPTDLEKRNVSRELDAGIEPFTSNELIDSGEFGLLDQRSKVRVAAQFITQGMFVPVYNHTRERIGNAIGRLEKKSTINLMIGISIAMAGFFYLLGVLIFEDQPVATDQNYMEIARYYLSRLSVVILIQVFAYFFLRLYRGALSEIKFLENELTNVEMKMLGLNAALALGEKSAIQELVKQMGTTERNFVLRDGETTVELERTKMEEKMWSEALDAVVRAVGGGRRTSVVTQRWRGRRRKTGNSERSRT